MLPMNETYDASTQSALNAATSMLGGESNRPIVDFIYALGRFDGMAVYARIDSDQSEKVQ